MAEIWTMGETLVEIMRPKTDMGLKMPAEFIGPYPSGAPAIFIDTVARLGHSAGLISGVGKDDFGNCILERLKSDGVNVDLVKTDEKNATGCAFVTYFSDGSRKFIFHLANTPAASAKAPEEKVFKDVKYFHVMGCSLFAKLDFAKEILLAVKRARKQGAKISFDPNIRPELLGDSDTVNIINEIISYTDVFLPGREEILFLSGKKTIAEAVQEYLKQGIKVLVLKKGADGCTVYTKDEVIHQGIYKIAYADATGAGDSFDGAFICALIEGKTLVEAAKIASAAGALNTAAFGPMEGNITRKAIHELIEKENAK